MQPSYFWFSTFNYLRTMIESVEALALDGVDLFLAGKQIKRGIQPALFSELVPPEELDEDPFVGLLSRFRFQEYSCDAMGPTKVPRT